MTSLLIALQAVAGIAWGYLGAAIGAGLATVGAGIGIGKIGQAPWKAWPVSPKLAATSARR